MNRPSVHTESYLRSLSEAEWSELRHEATLTAKSCNPVLTCGDCRMPVYARESAQGRRHCYHFSGDYKDCAWANATGRNIRTIDAQKFQGKQESERHKILSQYVRSVLCLDDNMDERNISFRRYLKLENRECAYPDVYTESWQGIPTAFEVQLSTTHLPVIVRRERFYHDLGVRIVWIIDSQSENLSRRAFKDIYMRNDGQILGMDKETLDISYDNNKPHFRLHRLLPSSFKNGFVPEWRNKIVGHNEIKWGHHGDKPVSDKFSYDEYLNEMIVNHPQLSKIRMRFYDALKNRDEDKAGFVWDEAQAIVGGLVWNSLPCSPTDAVAAMGVLATVRSNKIYVETRIGIDNIHSIVNSMLLEPSGRRQWTRAFELLCKSSGRSELLDRTSIRKKCERNTRDIQDGPTIDRQAGAVFDFFFPEGAFFRIDLDR